MDITIKTLIWMEYKRIDFSGGSKKYAISPNFCLNQREMQTLFEFSNRLISNVDKKFTRYLYII